MFLEHIHICINYIAKKKRRYLFFIHNIYFSICAVYGGVYILGQPLEKYIIDQESGLCTGVKTSDNQVFTASHIITGLDYISPNWMTDSIDDSK